jgi:hypothetical protein
MNDDDLDEQLRAINPIPSSTSLTDADTHRRAALLEEILDMTQTTTNPDSLRQPGRKRYAGILAAGVVAAAIVGIIVFTTRNDDNKPTAAPTTSVSSTETPPIGLGSCVESYSLSTLSHRELVFDGTVSAIDGNQVTFTVNNWYKGGAESAVSLDGNGMVGGAITSSGGPTLTVGERYLVAGDGGFVWSCGFTQPYESGTAQQWRDALS